GRAIVRPLKELADATGAISRGLFNRRVKVRGRDEFAMLGRTFNEMASQLEARLEELAEERARARDAVARFGEALAATHDPYARLHRRVERQAVTDGLTDLPNRRRFEESLEQEITRMERFGGELSLIVADLDDFKQVNDRFGHQAGDDVLCAFARILRDCVREIDLPARHGGEEFAILLPQTD